MSDTITITAITITTMKMANGKCCVKVVINALNEFLVATRKLQQKQRAQQMFGISSAAKSKTSA